MFPISDSAKAARFPIITIIFVALNIYAFYLQATVADPQGFINQYALISSRIDFSIPSSLLPFITSMFLHADLFHIVSNMWFLWIFGDNVEGHFGKFFYPLVYLSSGLVGSFLQYITIPDSTIPMLGASGAVSGVLGAYYILFPHSRIKTLLLTFVITIVEIPAVAYLFYWFFIQFISGVFSIGAGSQDLGGVAFWAHVGGFITGVIFAKIAQGRFGNPKSSGYIEGEVVS